MILSRTIAATKSVSLPGRAISLRPPLVSASSQRAYTASAPKKPSAFTLNRTLLTTTGVIAIAGTYLFCQGRGISSDKDDAKNEFPNKEGKFTTRMKTDLGMFEHTHEHLGYTAAEALLRKNEVSKTFKMPTSKAGVVRFDNNWVACNASFEDRHVENFFSKDILSASKDIKHKADGQNWIEWEDTDNASLKLFSVIDGHGGSATANVLEKMLHPATILSLQRLYAGYKPSTKEPLSEMRSWCHGTPAFISKYKPFGHGTAFTLDENDMCSVNRDTIADALTTAFTQLDYHICGAPLRMIFDVPDDRGKLDMAEAISPALSGACAVTVMVDEDRQEVYVANTGDTRAVAGYWIPPHTAPNGLHFGGGWRCEVLTEDHNSRNVRELERLKREHPSEDLLCPDGRLLGNLMPTRAFGDAQWYKWTDEESRSIIDLVDGHEAWIPHRAYDVDKHKSMPYHTARPEVAIRSLESDKWSKAQLKFVIAATDGLWDLLSSDEAVGLVATHLKHRKHTPISRKAVQSGMIDQTRASSERHPVPKPKGEQLDGEWLYEDENAATHLIRNAFKASTTVGTVHEMLSTQPPAARLLRDDVTCSVVFFDSPTNEGTKPKATADEPKEKTGLAKLLQLRNALPFGPGPSAFVWKQPIFT